LVESGWKKINERNEVHEYVFLFLNYVNGLFSCVCLLMNC